MSETVAQFIQDVFETIKVYSPAETVLSSDQSRMLTLLNSMLDQWSISSLTCFAILHQKLTLQVGKTSYTVGSGGDLNITRPVRIIEGYGAAYSQDSNGTKYPCDVLTRAQWNGEIGYVNVTANVVTRIFYDSQYPLAILNVYPSPLEAYDLYFDSFTQLGQLANTGVTFDFPPGYREAIRLNLAVKAKPYWKTAQLDTEIYREARLTKRELKRMNRRTPNVVFDDYLVSRGVPTYNVYTDSSGT